MFRGANFPRSRSRAEVSNRECAPAGEKIGISVYITQLDSTEG